MKTLKQFLIFSLLSLLMINIQAQTRSSYSEEEIASVIKKCIQAIETSGSNASIPSVRYHYWCKNSVDGAVVMEGKADFIIINQTGKSGIAHTMAHLYFWTDEKPFYTKDISYISVNKEPLRCIVTKGEEGKSRKTWALPTMLRFTTIDTTVAAFWNAYSWISTEKKNITSTTMAEATDDEGNNCYLVSMTFDSQRIGGRHLAQYYIDKVSGLMHKIVISSRNENPKRFRNIGAPSANPFKNYIVEEEIAELHYQVMNGRMVMDKMHYSIKDSGVANQQSPCGKNLKHHMIREEEYQLY